MYNNKILEIFKNPTNAGGLQGANGIGKYIDESCGDYVKLYLKIDENQVIEEARFKTMGAVGSIVASSVLCKELIDLNVYEAKELSEIDIINITGEYPEDKEYTISFAIKALALAIEDYFDKIENEGKPKKRGRKPKEVQESVSGSTNVTVDDADVQDLTEQETDEDDEEYEEKNFSDEILNSLSDTSSESTVEKKELEDNNSINEIDEDTYYDDFEDELMFGDYNSIEQPSKISSEKKVINAEVDEELITTYVNTKRQKIKDASEELDGIRATKILEESKSYVPVIETKIISDEELAKKAPKQTETKVENESNVSRAKALFDSMFED